MFPGWLKQLLSANISKVGDLAQRVWQTFGLLWTIIRQLGESALHAWQHLYNIGNLVSATVHGALTEAYHTLKYVFFTLVPHYAADAINRAIRWSVDHIGALAHEVTVGLAALRALTGRLVGDLRADLTIGLRVLTDTANQLWAAFRKFQDLYAAILASPQRLITWVLPALATPLLRFLESRAEAIGVWILRKSIAAVVRELPLVERVIARII